MAIVTMLLRKMLKNRLLALSLLAGMCLCTALTSSMPIYKEAALQRMLLKELEQSYANTLRYPGILYLSASTQFQMESASQQAEFLSMFDNVVERAVHSGDPLELTELTKEHQTVTFRAKPADPSAADPKINRITKLVGRSHLQDHVDLIDGRWPASEPVDGVYEGLVTDHTLVQLGIVLGTELLTDSSDYPEPLRIKPVGVIAEKDLNDPYWDRARLIAYDNAFFIDETLFSNEILLGAKAPIGVAKWEALFDYNKFTVESANRLTDIKDDLKRYFDERLPYRNVVLLPAGEILLTYEEKEQALQSLLIALNVPIYILVAFYLFMVSNLLVERQRSEIAVLRSRGAGRWQIVAVFAVEAALLTAAAWIIGPYLGILFTSTLGSSDSFLSFVQRKALPVQVSGESFLYAGAAAVFSFLVYLIPVLLATRFSIVDEKRSSSRQNRSGLWQRFGLDFVLIAVSLYGLYSLRNRLLDLLELGLDSNAITVDPLLFAVPSFFILGIGLLSLRLYPYFVSCIYWIGKSKWSAPQYSSLLQVSRRARQYHVMMIFLILTVGTSIYSASAARTINGNIEDQIRHANGSDIVISQQWVDDAPIEDPTDPSSAATSRNRKINYLEPPFEPFLTLPGVQHAARVFTKNDAVFAAGKNMGTAKLMGIVTDEFGLASWMKDGLLDYHFYDYLNLIAGDPRAVLVSQTLAEQYGVVPGDLLEIGWNNSRIEVTVYAVMEHFPAFNPNHQKVPADPDAEKPMLVVAHLETLQNELALEPYEVWIQTTSPDDRAALYSAIEDRRIPIASIRDTYEQIVESRNDPYRMAMNGVMSLGFILSLLISITGFLLYWMLTLQGRTLQFGIFRAIGISYRQLTGMMTIEQLLTSGAGFAIGLLTGTISSLLFIPMLQISFHPGRIVPPFEVMIESADTGKLTILIGIALFAALLILMVLIRRIKLHQALRLGED